MCYFINWGEEDSIRRGHTMDCWNLTLLCIPVVQRWTVTIRGNDTNYRVEYDKLQHAPWPEVRLCGGTQWLRVTCPAVTRVWVKSILVNNPSVSATIMEVSRRLLNLVQLWFRAENDFKKTLTSPRIGGCPSVCGTLAQSLLTVICHWYQLESKGWEHHTPIPNQVSDNVFFLSVKPPVSWFTMCRNC